MVTAKSSAILTVDVGDGIQQINAALSTAVNRDLPNNLHHVHLRKLRDMNQKARMNFYTRDIKRVQERGSRHEHRETGKFTFGSGGTFVGLIINEGSIQGFGYPQVQKADLATNYVWRSLEFGLAPHPAAVSDPMAPRGVGRFPRAFTFDPWGEGGKGVFKLLREAPGSRIIRGAKHPGIEPKFFIRDAWNEVMETMDSDYRQATEKAFKL